MRQILRRVRNIIMVKRHIQLTLVLCVVIVVIFYEGSRRDDVISGVSNISQTVTPKLLTRTMRTSSKKNVLFIMSDDLRPQLNCYKGEHFPNPNSDVKMHTPSIDKLASESLLFSRAYVQMAICGPSRASLLTGRRLDTISNWHLNHNFRMGDRNVTSLPQHFKNMGYQTEAVGKIFHRGTNWQENDPISWSSPWRGIRSESENNNRYGNWSWSAATKAEREEHPLQDEVVLEQALKLLKELTPAALTGERSFFLGVGFLKPHLPFVFPEEFLDLYPLDKMDAPSGDNKYFPKHYPQSCFMDHAELTTYPDVQCEQHLKFNEVFPDAAAKMYRRAYFATVSFVDSLVGILMEELDALGLSDNTVVTFMGDHGWHLGENGIWGKYTNFEQATHTPLMLKVPGRTEQGIVTDSVVEFVDIFQTVVEAAGLESIPECPAESGHINLCTEGISLLPLIDDPDMKVKDGAVSQIFTYHGPRMSYSVRSDRYRYTEWIPIVKVVNNTKTNYHLRFEEIKDFELYDLKTDPEENVNLAGQVGYEDVTTRHRKYIRDAVKPTLYDVKNHLF